MKQLILVLLLLSTAMVAAQGAPEQIDDALRDLSQRVGVELTLNDLFWTWAQQNYDNTSLGCPQEGQTYTQTPVVGYEFTFRYGGNIYDYRVSADRSIVFLCDVTPESDEDTTDEPDPINPDTPPYSNPLCPEPPEGLTYIRTRLAPGIQARVVPGLPINLRQQPDSVAAITGEIPGGSIFTVLSGPACEDTGALWWQVDYDGLIGWTAEGRNGSYFVEPLPAAPIAADRPVIGAASDFIEVSRLQANYGRTMAFADTSTLLVTGGTGAEGLFVYDLALLESAPRFLRGRYRLTDIDFATDPSLALLGSADGGVRLWDLRPNPPLLERAFLLGHQTAVTAVAFSQDGSRLASSGGRAFLQTESEGNQYAIALWDVDTVSLSGGLRGHTDTVTALTFNAGGQELISVSLDRTLRVWSLVSGQGEIRLETSASINAMAYYAPNSLVALALTSGDVLLFNPFSSEIVATLQAHTAAVNSVAFNTDGTLLASGADDSNVLVWDMAALSAQPTTFSANSGAIRDVLFSPDGTMIVFLSEDNTVRFLVGGVRAVG